jgi:fructokinase
MDAHAPFIIVAGEAIYDLIPVAGERQKYEVALGGSSFITAIGLARQGVATAFCGRLSQDAAGEAFVARLKESGVDQTYVARPGEPSALAIIAPGSEASGPRYALYLTGTAHDGPAGLPWPWPSNAAHLHAASFHALIGRSGDDMLNAMRDLSGRATISFDPNIRPPVLPPREAMAPLVEARVRLATIVKASEEDMLWLYPDRAPEDSITAWKHSGPALVVLTRGAQGAVAFAACGRVEVRAPVVNVVDTVGAGDTFMAALLSQMFRDDALGADRKREIRSDRLTTWLDYAAQAAALACARHGADPPTRDEVVRFGRPHSSVTQML